MLRAFGGGVLRAKSVRLATRPFSSKAKRNRTKKASPVDPLSSSSSVDFFPFPESEDSYMFGVLPLRPVRKGTSSIATQENEEEIQQSSFTEDVKVTADHLVSEEAHEYNKHIYALVKSKNFRAALTVFDQMKEKRIQPNWNTYTSLITAYCEARNRVMAISLYNELKEEQVELPLSAYNAIIAALAKAHELGTAIRVYKDMRKLDIVPNVLIYNTLISAYGHGKQLDKAFETFDDLKSNGLTPTVYIYNSLIAACGTALQTDKALDVFEEMKKAPGIKPDVVTYTALITAFGRAGNVRKAHEMFAEMKSKKIKPSRPTYNSLLMASNQEHPMPKTFELLDEMKRSRRRQDHPDSKTYNYLIDLCRTWNKPHKGWALFEEMCHMSDLKFTRYTYNNLIALLAANSMESRALQVVAYMESENISGDSFTYLSLVSMYAKANEFQKVYDLFDQMMRSRDPVRPDAGMFAHLVSAAGNSDDEGAVKTVFEKMREYRVKADAVTYNSLIAIYLKEDVQKVFELYEEMKQKRIELNGTTLNFILLASLKARDIALAVETYSAVRHRGEFPSSPACIQFIRLISRHRPDLAMSVFEDMEQNWKKLDIRAYNKIIHELCRTNIETALEVFERAKSRGMEPKWYTYRPLMAALLREDNQVDRAVQLMHECMTTYRADEEMYSQLLQVFGAGFASEMVIKLFKEMKDKRMTPSLDDYNEYLTALVRKNRLHSVKRCVDEMVAVGLELDVLSYNNLIEAYCTYDSFDTAEEALQKMLAAGVKPNNRTYHIFIKWQGRNGRRAEAERWWDKLKSSGLPLKAMDYNQIMKAQERCEQDASDATLLLYEEMKTLGVPPDVMTYDILMRVAASIDDLLTAESLFELAKKTVPGRLEVFATMINIYGSREERLEDALAVLDELKLQDEFKVSTAVYNLSIALFTRARDLSKTVELFEELRQLRLRPNFNTFYSLATAYSQAGRLQDAFASYQQSRLPQHRITYTAKQYNSVLKLFSGDFQLMMKVYDDFKRDGNAAPNFLTFKLLFETADSAQQFDAMFQLFMDMKHFKLSLDNKQRRFFKKQFASNRTEQQMIDELSVSIKTA